ncbi:MAG: hypothetical protein WC986_14680 [Elusimicrobiota bacterium]
MSCPACGARNAALLEAMERVAKKDEALRTEKANALPRFEELENKLRKARMDLKDANDRIVTLTARVKALEIK